MNDTHNSILEKLKTKEEIKIKEKLSQIIDFDKNFNTLISFLENEKGNLVKKYNLNLDLHYEDTFPLYDYDEESIINSNLYQAIKNQDSNAKISLDNIKEYIKYNSNKKINITLHDTNDSENIINYHIIYFPILHFKNYNGVINDCKYSFFSFCFEQIPFNEFIKNKSLKDLIKETEINSIQNTFEYFIAQKKTEFISLFKRQNNTYSETYFESIFSKFLEKRELVLSNIQQMISQLNHIGFDNINMIENFYRHMSYDNITNKFILKFNEDSYIKNLEIEFSFDEFNTDHSFSYLIETDSEHEKKKFKTTKMNDFFEKITDDLTDMINENQFLIKL